MSNGSGGAGNGKIKSSRDSSAGSNLPDNSPDINNVKSNIKNNRDDIKEDRRKEPRKSSEGTLSKPVGTGKHARTNIIWYIISAIFVIFACISSALIIMSINGNDTKSVSESIKDTWGVFSPVLTLALGYLFGKQGSHKKRKKKKEK